MPVLSFATRGRRFPKHTATITLQAEDTLQEPHASQPLIQRARISHVVSCAGAIHDDRRWCDVQQIGPEQASNIVCCICICLLSTPYKVSVSWPPDADPRCSAESPLTAETAHKPLVSNLLAFILCSDTDTRYTLPPPSHHAVSPTQIPRSPPLPSIHANGRPAGVHFTAADLQGRPAAWA